MLQHGARSARLCSNAGALEPGQLFCNLYLHPFDQALTNKHIPFVRYADDLPLFTETESQARAALTVAEQGLRGLDLALHPDKTRIVRSHQGVEFLGQRLPDADSARPQPAKARKASRPARNSGLITRRPADARPSHEKPPRHRHGPNSPKRARPGAKKRPRPSSRRTRP
ncbi:MAG: hypothetical protein LJE69_08890 [Thiohalocapsa sp.]|uniref:reverse transcriptase domain-containing protein n=1 Tax=Thiohalocapsa sp. TaxID=2497641 RepID=UPI0025DD9010|nr:reverse transcriptase domain-containing protein [Thiohalocapsa sp.]MCG6941354.1 hypothetical protein [Thiohalocapsa sp.]